MENSNLIASFILVVGFVAALFVLLFMFIDSQFAKLEAIAKEINEKLDSLCSER